MAEFKLVISTKDGKSMQKDVKGAEAKPLLGKKIGDKISGDDFGMPGFEFELRGGSDNCGFPMRKDVTGTGRKRILAVSGVGLKKKRKGQKQRKTVCGNTIHSGISQVNLKVLKEGKMPKVAEAPKEKKEPEKKEAKAPEKKEEKPAPKEVKEVPKEEKEPKEEKTAPAAPKEVKEAPKEEENKQAKEVMEENPEKVKEEKPVPKAEEKKEESPEKNSENKEVPKS